MHLGLFLLGEMTIGFMTVQKELEVEAQLECCKQMVKILMSGGGWTTFIIDIWLVLFFEPFINVS